MISIRSTAKGASYLCYLISSTHPNHKQRTYVGVKNDTHRRLRQHNREIIGGAKSTNIGRPWDVWMIIEGFPNQSTCLKFEWMWKHMKPRSSHCKKARITKLRNLLCKEQCTRNSPLAKTMPLTVTVFDRFNESDCNNARKYGSLWAYKLLCNDDNQDIHDTDRIVMLPEYIDVVYSGSFKDSCKN